MPGKLFALGFICTGFLAAQTFTVTTDLVTLDVQVESKATGRAVDGLRSDDFLVQEDGVPQKLAYFGRDQLPLSVVFTLDLAQSVRSVGDVHKYARETGGVVVKLGGGDPPSELALLIDRLRARYTLGYRPSAEQPGDKFCAIQVKLNPEAERRHGPFIVRARRGYYRPAKPRG